MQLSQRTIVLAFFTSLALLGVSPMRQPLQELLTMGTMANPPLFPRTASYWETMAGGTFRVIPEKPVTARFVRYRIKSDRNFCATELEVLDSIEHEPFDLRIALPK